jgi:RHS repeat-associated protein
MLASVKKPDGKMVEFEYDALGRRTAKIFDGSITRFIWDGNVLLHEWKYELAKRPQLVVAADGTMQYDKVEEIENLVTWHYELNSFTPCSKEEDGRFYSIISDYLGTPTHAFDENGKKVWERQIDCYGRLRSGDNKFVPFLYPGQYVDGETGLAYNRYRYYDVESERYISQDPIGLAGGNLTMYGYVANTNV